MTTISQPPVVLAIPTIGTQDDLRQQESFPVQQPIICFKDNVTNIRHEQWKVWVARERFVRAMQNQMRNDRTWAWAMANHSLIP